MKIFIFTEAREPKDCTIEVKYTKFTEANREALREHTKKEHYPTPVLVWFQDEHPPSKVVEVFQSVEGDGDAQAD